MTSIKKLRMARTMLLALMLTLLASCNLYNEPFRTKEALAKAQAASAAAHTSANYTLQYIEADDRGWFWNPEQANDALKLVQTETAKQDTLVLLFIHGWHHSADCYDGNLEAFKHLMDLLSVELQENMYRSARTFVNNGHTPPPVKIVGIYIGWRGRSLPGLLDYATFWGRKSAAERVGAGDLQEFMARLQRMYNDHNTPADPHGASAAPQQNKPFFGLVSIGHSFGGAVLLTATSRYFESELQDANPAITGFARQRPQAVTPAASPQSGDTQKPLGGFGDMVILVNPAIEAAAYERINVLSRGVIYSPSQTPLLVTFSAINDQPRNTLFKPGRIAGEFFTNAAPIHDDRERSAEREALGAYDLDRSGVTHWLSEADKPAGTVSLPAKQYTNTLTDQPLSPNSDMLCDGQTADKFDWWTWMPQGGSEEKTASSSLQGTKVKTEESIRADAPVEEVAQKVKAFDFSANLIFADLALTQAPPPDAPWQYQPYQPFMVVSVEPNIINGHNGIFSDPFVRFLLRYIGFIEAKRFLLSKQLTSVSPAAPTQ